MDPLTGAVIITGLTTVGNRREHSSRRAGDRSPCGPSQ